ncbi:HAMP domain-containing sensor histidine kinase [Hyphomicrobium sp.]|uniref:sensor histidine kinase n=1 Tax=Hyphomicrobium sp. TaxID=82 RepID=UPI0025C27032|nr:HAMP domain-containing sensor histidine kinase [Hyphomicrobium sp.]MCC7253737.1 HAMP domain-containing histidine kinase [Hyphomicrobium sp.]
MAGTLSACPREESALEKDAGPARDGAAFLPLLDGPGAVRLLQGAVAVHSSALAFTLFHPISLPSLAALASGLVVSLVALAVPRLAPVSSARPAEAKPVSDLSPPQVGSGALPSPLPFMGERIALSQDAAQLTVLARAAARLGRSAQARAHPWGDLMARVSHELRTPLNAVIGFSDVMQSELLGPVGHPRYREYVRHIGDCGRDLLKSAEDTLAITCLLDHDPAAAVATGVDLRMMVEEAWAFHAGPSSSHGLSLDLHVPEDIEVLVERRPMRQILINLLAEAVRRADARGTVGVVATVDGDLVQVEVYLRGQPGAPSVGQASLPICLARALLELNGASLIEVDDPHSTWRAVTVLRCVAQCDFFEPLPETKPVHHQPATHFCQVACA